MHFIFQESVARGEDLVELFPTVVKNVVAKSVEVNAIFSLSLFLSLPLSLFLSVALSRFISARARRVQHTHTLTHEQKPPKKNNE